SSSFGAEEDRVGKRRVVVDVGKAGEGKGEAGADAGAQRADVAVGGRVASLVVALGVDREAVDPAPHGRGADLGLGQRPLAVDELPGADVDSAAVERLDQTAAELTPVVV